jgi:hypothetical protein
MKLSRGLGFGTEPPDERSGSGISIVRPASRAFLPPATWFHVHDLVDFVSDEADIAGKFAAQEAAGYLSPGG